MTTAKELAKKAENLRTVIDKYLPAPSRSAERFWGQVLQSYIPFPHSEFFSRRLTVA
jgi:hypothetical protein